MSFSQTVLVFHSPNAIHSSSLQQLYRSLKDSPLTLSSASELPSSSNHTKEKLTDHPVVVLCDNQNDPNENDDVNGIDSSFVEVVKTVREKKGKSVFVVLWSERSARDAVQRTLWQE